MSGITLRGGYRSVVNIMLLFLIGALTGCGGGGSSSTTAGTVPDTGTTTGTEVKLLNQTSVAAVSNNPPTKSTFTLSGATRITKILTYHWNSGNGDTPGTLSLKNTASGTVYGPWTAIGNKTGVDFTPGATWPTTASGPPYLYWIAQPNVDVPAGTYEVVDSKPATWSYTSDLGNKGYTLVFGFDVGGTSNTGDVLPAGFSIGAKTSTSVNATGYKEIIDPVSGYTFIFPTGGSGTLTVAKITAAPDRPFTGGTGYSINFSGNETVKIKVPFSSGNETCLLGYGAVSGSMDDGIDRDNRWIALPQESSVPGFLIYELTMPFTYVSKTAVKTKKTTTGGYKGTSQYWITSLPSNSTDTEKRVAIGLQVATDIDGWINVLSEPLKTNARNAVNGRLNYYKYMRYDGNYYIGFSRHKIFNVTTPMLGIMMTASDQKIAHEVGHYMTHVLAGDALYLAIEDTTPDANHGPGDVHAGRSSVVEDYAYFSQYLLTGSIDGADPTYPRLVLGQASPATKDFPSVEGFGSVLLASITRTNPSTIGMISNTSEDVPVVGAPFGDIAGIIARGAADGDTLRTHIEDYLKTKGQESKFPAIAERIGWSYRGSGRIVDSSGSPLSGVTVEAVSKVGATVYSMPAANKKTTGSDGTFTLSRIFPGQSFIRITKGEQVFDAPITVDWMKPTTELIALGDIPNRSTALPTTCSASAQVTYRARHWNDPYNVEHYGYPPTFLTDYGSMPIGVIAAPGTYSGLSYSSSRNINERSTITGTLTFQLNASGTTITQFSGFEKTVIHTEPSFGGGYEIEIAGGELPVSIVGGRLTAEVRGVAACSKLTKLDKRNYDYKWSLLEKIEDYRCDATSYLRVSCE